jgi:hypothetical protein
LLIYLDAGSDPFTNNNGGTMLGQNQTTCEQRGVVGNANYDIGPCIQYRWRWCSLSRCCFPTTRTRRAV